MKDARRPALQRARRCRLRGSAGILADSPDALEAGAPEGPEALARYSRNEECDQFERTCSWISSLVTI